MTNTLVGMLRLYLQGTNRTPGRLAVTGPTRGLSGRLAPPPSNCPSMTVNVIPVNSLVRHVAPLHGMLAAAADDVIRSGYFVLGPGVSAFEQQFADYCGAAQCIGVGNGTDALELSLKAVGVDRGDQVAV